MILGEEFNEIIELDRVAGGAEAGVLHGGGQLVKISGPAVGFDQLGRLVGDFFHGDIEQLGLHLQEMLGQGDEIILALAKGGKAKAVIDKPVFQVFGKQAAAEKQVGSIAAGGDHAHIQLLC